MMRINFFNHLYCEDSSFNKLFGLCDDENDHTPAYLDENNQENWIAEVHNENCKLVSFVAIDHCITLPRRKCDCLLFYDETIIFVELKDRGGNPRDWKDDAEEQLRQTITIFEQQEEANNYTTKVAYIANKKVGKHNTRNHQRMTRFKNETGYILKIQNRIDIV